MFLRKKRSAYARKRYHFARTLQIGKRRSRSQGGMRQDLLFFLRERTAKCPCRGFEILSFAVICLQASRYPVRFCFTGIGVKRKKSPNTALPFLTNGGKRSIILKDPLLKTAASDYDDKTKFCSYKIFRRILYVKHSNAFVLARSRRRIRA